VQKLGREKENSLVCLLARLLCGIFERICTKYVKLRENFRLLVSCQLSLSCVLCSVCHPKNKIKKKETRKKNPQENFSSKG